MDIVPTIYDIASITPSNDSLFLDHQLPQGRSIVKQWISSEKTNTDAIYAFELFGNKSVRKGVWKVLYLSRPLGASQWELYNLALDPSETRDVSQSNQKILNVLVDEYNQYKIRNNVIAPENPIMPDISGTYTGECGWLCEATFFWQAGPEIDVAVEPQSAGNVPCPLSTLANRCWPGQSDCMVLI